MIKIVLFNLIALIHILIWAFILFAFMNINTASVNLFLIIPAIYILNILPFHIINIIKNKMYPNDWEEKASKVENCIFIVKYFRKMQEYTDKHCFESPVSPQGMLIFGALSSAYVLLNKCDYKPIFNL